ncbi:MAG: phosphoribosyltransferase family protein [Phycisphaerales bacterium]|nr:phosphoribosyltransferase family protein [Phycisphaerales bacterium]
MSRLHRKTCLKLDGLLGDWLGYSQAFLGDNLTRLAREEADLNYCQRCGQGVGRGEPTSTGCGTCRGRSAILDGVVRVGPFHGVLAELIRSLKYGGRWELAEPMGQMLAERLKPRIQIHRGECHWAIIPIPMPRWRRWYRGVDHAGLIAASVARHLEFPLLMPLKKRGGPPQATLSRSRRNKSSRDDYRVVRAGIRGFGGVLPNLEDRSVILIDDVLTTGRSMCAAGSQLRRLGPARIIAGALAVTEKRESPK